MGAETEKQLEMVKTPSPANAIAAVPRPQKKPKRTKSKLEQGRADTGARAREETQRQRRWLFNGVGLISIVVVGVILWAAISGAGPVQQLGLAGLGQLIGVAMFFAGRAAKSGRDKPG